MTEELKLDFSGLSNSDIFNLALQRTDALLALPIRGGISPSFVAWQRLGLDFPLALEVALRRPRIIRRCEADISAEVAYLVELLGEKRSLKIVDIGPGLGIHDAALAERLDVSEMLLIDIEESNAKHHGFAAEGAGYNSLATTKAFIEAQGSGTKIETLNPRHTPLENVYGRTYDLIMSLLSCGFHYPADTYLDFYRYCLKAGEGRLILDLRRGINHERLLEEFAIVDSIEKGKKHDRVVLQRK
jgi:hypothetical protein